MSKEYKSIGKRHIIIRNSATKKRHVISRIFTRYQPIYISLGNAEATENDTAS